MREIKFRKWTKYINGEMGMVDNDILGGQTLYNLTKRDDDILMQYTGLKDKNGKEIYEGDILQGYNKDGSEYKIGEVEWIEFRNNELDISEGFGWDIRRDEIVEIIGNVYENPELLTNPELEAYNDVMGNRD